LASTSTKITILVDNNACGPAAASRGLPAQLASEHGLSFWIESGDQHILFDTGQGPALAANVTALGIDLSATDILVLSHGHHDHTGGVPQVLRAAPRAEVYCHPAIFRTRYSIRQGKAESIGIPKRSSRSLGGLPPERLRWVSGPVMLSEHIGITGPIPRLTGYEGTGGPFYQDKAGRRPDPLEDDLALWVRTEGGLVVCSGCAHSGAVNTLDYVRNLNHGLSVLAIIGGLHLLNANEERLDKTIEALGALKIPSVVPCHCTGAGAFRALDESLGERVSPGAAGMTLQF
jgi:7,8-dihydropterin-6-yl-methyl-4-(beta-D-ribofuranosyl)aminobenzene 5'-phosphate synthase